MPASDLQGVVTALHDVHRRTARQPAQLVPEFLYCPERVPVPLEEEAGDRDVRPVIDAALVVLSAAAKEHGLDLAIERLTNVDEILLLNFFGAFAGVLLLEEHHGRNAQPDDEQAVEHDVAAGDQRMHALGDVVLLMPQDGRRLESGELHYDPLTERIWSDSASTYRHDGRVTQGTCFRSDLSFLNYEICNIRGAADLGGA